jgi:hypothetical protein
MTLAAAVFLSLGPAFSAARQQEDFPGFGSFVLAVGDVDGDKLGDLLVLDSIGVGFGAGGWLPGPKQARAWIVSPAAGRVHFDFGARELAWQSLKSAAVGDVDGDGHADLALLETPSDERQKVSLEIWSGKERRVTRNLNCAREGERFGASFASLGDVDGDGFGELAIGAPGASRDGKRVGAVHIVRVRDGSIVSSVWGDAANTGFGESVIALGDLDRDGACDFAVNSSWETRFYCGRTGVRRRMKAGLALRVVERCGDVDRDGRADFIGFERGRESSMSRHAFSGADGSLLQTTELPLGIYHEVQTLGDLDGDGKLDFVCADYKRGVSQGLVDVVSGSGQLFWSSGESTHWHYGWALDVLGDVDGDGRVDIAVGVDHFLSREDGVLYVYDARNGRTVAELHRRGDDVRVWKPEPTPSKPK